TVIREVKSVDNLHIWDLQWFVHLCLAAIFKDPFHGGKNILVLAETYNNNGTPNHTNYHHHVQKTMDLAKDKHPWFGLKQEYTLFDTNGTLWLAQGWFPWSSGPALWWCWNWEGLCAQFDQGALPCLLVHWHKISGIAAKVMPSQCIRISVII
ncbi:unnamed protein product, partial [Rhizoctonia solani]